MTPQGWLCPCCLVVYAPSVMKCECRKAKEVRQGPVPKVGLAEFEKLAMEMDEAKLKKERPFYPPPPLELANPPWNDVPRPIYFTGETPEDAKFFTV